MERRLKERLIGAAVLVMLAVIFIPMILDNTSKTHVTITETNIPARSEDGFNSRIVPLKESDLRSLPAEPVVQAEPVQVPAIPQAQVKPTLQETPVIEQNVAPISVRPRQHSAGNNQMGATAWVVQLGSFNSEENAKGLNKKLRKAGFPAFVEPLKKESGVVYRVRVGPEILRSHAQTLQQKLKKKMQIDGIVIRYP